MYVDLVAGGTGTNVAGYLFLERQYLFPLPGKTLFRTSGSDRWRLIVDNLRKLGITGLIAGRAVVGTLPAP